jgi:predicted ATPase
LAGFRSIRDTGEGLDLGPVNVLIGANGTGKSNLIAFFRMLNFLTSGSLAAWLEMNGAGAAQLYYGPKLSPQVTASLAYETDAGRNVYALRLLYGGDDRLLFADERVEYHRPGAARPFEHQFGAGHRESALLSGGALTGNSALASTSRIFRSLLGRTRVFHFFDTSPEARVMRPWFIHDGDYLKYDGANLAPLLYRLRTASPGHYARIVEVIRQVVPFFGDFVLAPSGLNAEEIVLRWQEVGSDMVLSARQFSDGTLRFIMLATLLLLPADELPLVILIDEPELGLHPAAIRALANMVYGLPDGVQVIMTTQSPALLDCFDPGEVVVVTRPPEGAGARYETRFQRLDAAALRVWLEQYCLSELWDQGVLGGRPTA